MSKGYYGSALDHNIRYKNFGSVTGRPAVGVGKIFLPAVLGQLTRLIYVEEDPGLVHLERQLKLCDCLPLVYKWL